MIKNWYRYCLENVYRVVAVVQLELSENIDIILVGLALFFCSRVIVEIVVYIAD